MAEKRKVEWTNDWTLHEIYSGGLQMALCSPPDDAGTYKKATTFVTCKDFFQDAVQAHFIGQERSIWNFRYNPKTDPALSLDRFRVLVGNKADPDFAGKIEAVVDFVNQYEKRVHLIRTKAYECEPTPQQFEKTGGVYMFEGSGRWMLAPPMVSLYTLLLRCGFVHKRGDDFDATCKGIIEGKINLGNKAKRPAGCYDDHYLRDAQPAIKAIEEHGYARLFYKDAEKNFPASIAVGTMHDCCGIVGYSQRRIKSEMPYWYRLLDQRPRKLKSKSASQKPAVAT